MYAPGEETNEATLRRIYYRFRVAKAMLKEQAARETAAENAREAAEKAAADNAAKEKAAAE